MKVARIVGRVIATAKDATLVGHKLLLLEPLDAEGVPAGPSFVGTDSVGAGAAELVFYVEGREAAFPFFPVDATVDACVVAIIDQVEPPVRRPAAATAGRWPFRRLPAGPAPGAAS